MFNMLAITPKVLHAYYWHVNQSSAILRMNGRKIGAWGTWHGKKYWMFLTSLLPVIILYRLGLPQLPADSNITPDCSLLNYLYDSRKVNFMVPMFRKIYEAKVTIEWYILFFLQHDRTNNSINFLVFSVFKIILIILKNRFCLLSPFLPFCLCFACDLKFSLMFGNHIDSRPYKNNGTVIRYNIMSMRWI